MKKVYTDAAAALAGLLRDDMMVMCGGFGLCGIPDELIEAVRLSGVKGLTVVSNNAGIDGVGLGKLLDTRQVRKMISSRFCDKYSENGSPFTRRLPPTAARCRGIDRQTITDVRRSTRG